MGGQCASIFNDAGEWLSISLGLFLPRKRTTELTRLQAAHHLDAVAQQPPGRPHSLTVPRLVHPGQLPRMSPHDLAVRLPWQAQSGATS
jgi:hypothetical protein